MDTFKEKSAIEEVATDGTVTDKEATDETRRAMAFVTTEEQRTLKDAIEKAELEGKSLPMPYCGEKATSQHSDEEESVTGASSVSNVTEGDEERTNEANESDDNEQLLIEGERAAALEVNNEILRVIQEELQNISTKMLEFNREMSELACESQAKDKRLGRLQQPLQATEAQVESIKMQTTTAATDPKSAQLN